MIRRLITDRDVLSGAVTSPLVIDEGTLITPAARDRARLAGIEIIERDALPRSPGAPCAGCGGAGCARCGSSCGGGCAACAGAGCGACSGARPAAALAGPTPADRASLEGLADGLYLVRVEGGRPTSVLPATGPGQMTSAREQQS